MKLSDLPRVGELKKSRDYLRDLHMNARAKPILVLNGFDLRPDLVAALKPALIDVIGVAIEAIDRDLAGLGVEV
ncbi:hypothetical protein PMNALOAF_2729 [Methylobacterium adhaesivum]|uniref:Uncharacterized protein n=1 Tax=Methylobacterium adhaesivum TaxID=333297 RepID=A0ABT8BIX0_9HYPH|nr:hypothetical protein [Methylobacterium adhaesivum]MDN3592084.1 hypothetical protein [Methylobacterium adhaesivum]GJD31470.1 hypothetical protein PMNALOAF_2729 [Methylobacterium adhaesivum]